MSTITNSDIQNQILNLEAAVAANDVPKQRTEALKLQTLIAEAPEEVRAEFSRPNKPSVAEITKLVLSAMSIGRQLIAALRMYADAR